MNPAATAILHGLRQSWSKSGVPGYRAGATVARVARELQAIWPTPDTEAAGVATAVPLLPPRGASACLIRESVERHFLMHVVNVELLIGIPSSTPACGAIRLHHTGTFRRGMLVHRLSGPHDEHCAALARRMCEDATVRTALTGLDQRCCEIVGRGDTWELRIQPFGGCDVVGRMPAYRRYVRLGTAQVKTLQTAAGALVDVISELL